MGFNNKEVDGIHWLIFFIVIFSLKYLIFCIDPLPMFFLGDSHSYIATSLTGWIPPDRSFIYGYVIRLTAVAAHSLTTLVAVQVFTSGLSAILVAYALIKFFSVTPFLAFSMGFLCAVEPLQLMYERYVMTETLALFLFAVYMVFIFHYIKRPTIILMSLVQIIGTALISFRLSFLPLVLINAFILPFLAIPVFKKKYSLKWLTNRDFLHNLSSHRLVIKIIALHLLVSIGLTYSLHLGYKHLNGFLSHNPPAYHYASGFFSAVSLCAFGKTHRLSQC